MSSASLDYCGIILTRMRWDKPLWWAFNAALLVYQLTMLSVGKVIGKVKATWREIWWAAQICHVRMITEHDTGDVWKAISITAPRVKFDYWTPGQIAASRGHFIYLGPMFHVTPEEIDNLIKAAKAMLEKPTARRYDYGQLFSFLINFPLWLFYWPCWGRELIKTFNLPGSREVCSTGIASLLQNNVSAFIGKRFEGHDTAMVSPCLYSISKSWKASKYA